MTRLHRIIQLSCLALLLGLALISVGVTYARYTSTVQQELNFEVKTVGETGTFRLASTKGWQATADGMTLDFTIAPEGAAESPVTVCLRLTATETLSDDVTVSLSADGKTYTATASAIRKEDVLYAQMGGGTLFSFADANGELGWLLTAEKTMRLTVQGASDEALLRLVVQEK